MFYCEGSSSEPLVSVRRDDHEANKLGRARYEYVRRLSVVGFKELYDKSMSGMGFDDLVDAAIASRRR